MGHEETFNYLLNAEHDDKELSKVCVSNFTGYGLAPPFVVGFREQYHFDFTRRNEAIIIIRHI
jgi:hypothetical protein